MWLKQLFKRKKKRVKTDLSSNELVVAVRVDGLDEFLDAMQQMEKAVDSLTKKYEELNSKVGAVCKQFPVTNNYHLSV